MYLFYFSYFFFLLILINSYILITFLEIKCKVIKKKAKSDIFKEFLIKK